jgi:hypothetical protein
MRIGSVPLAVSNHADAGAIATRASTRPALDGLTRHVLGSPLGRTSVFWGSIRIHG